MSEQSQMMTQHGHPSKLIRIGIAALLALLLVGAVTTNVRQAAWSQGYALGLIAGSDGGDALSQYLLYNNGAPGWGAQGRGGPPAAFFVIGLLIFSFFAVTRLARMGMMGRMAGEPWGASASRRPGPPWHTEPADKTEQTPDTPAGEATVKQ